MVDEGMAAVGTLAHLSSLDLSMVFNATGARKRPASPAAFATGTAGIWAPLLAPLAAMLTVLCHAPMASLVCYKSVA